MHKRLITDVLRDELNFTNGFVHSDGGILPCLYHAAHHALHAYSVNSAATECLRWNSALGIFRMQAV